MNNVFSWNDLLTLSQEASPEISGQPIAQIISRVFTNYFLPAAGIVMFFYLIFGGFEVILSAGNPKSAASGKGKITNALIGFVIIFAAYWIVQGVAAAFGFGSFNEIFQ